MTGDGSFSPNVNSFSANPNFEISIEECSQNSEKFLEEEGNDDLENECQQLFQVDDDDLENERDEKILIDGQPSDGNDVTVTGDYEIFGDDITIIVDHEHERDESSANDCQIDISGGKDYPPPVSGMEFESYDDAYNFYNCYAKELGFAIRVKSSWTKRNSKEKRGAVLCCNCEGFKTVKEVNSRRKETRTGCLAMIRLRLVESNRWRVDEVKLEHNHSFDPERAQNSKSHKRIDAGTKRKVEPAIDVEVRTIKLYRTSATDAIGYQSSSQNEGESKIYAKRSSCLQLKKGDAQVIYDFFRRVQLTDPNFFYVTDLLEEGFLRNVFWIDSRCRAAYSYFGDVVAFDTTFLSSNFEIPLVAFVGINHHGHSILLGCGFLADETQETYIWLLRAWLTCMSGRPPQTIITNRCKALQSAVAEVFPRAHHRFCLSYVMQSIFQNVGELQESEAFHMVLSRTIYNCVKVEEFEMAWEEMIQHFGLKNNECLQYLYDDRERWAPIFSKDTFFAGMYNCQKDEWTIPFFNGYVHPQSSLKEFFDTYEFVLQKKHQSEALHDFESNNWTPTLKSRHYYELQLSKLYTKEIFNKLQDETVMISSCYIISEVQTNGVIATYVVKERTEDESLQDAKSYEVMYDKAGGEIRCICSCFNFKGYLCRHALFILNYNGTEEIPYQYILSRWRKDFKRLYVPDLGFNNIDITNPVQWFDNLYRRAMQVVEEGMKSQNHYMVAWQALKDSLKKVRLVSDEHV